MKYFAKLSDIVVVLVSILLICFISFKECSNDGTDFVKGKYYLVSEAHAMARNLFTHGRTNYDRLKNQSLEAIDTILDLVHIMNNEMAREMRSSVVKFYKIKYFHDFTNYVISMEEMIEIVEHCLVGPVEKLQQIREHFHGIIKNFEDVRDFHTVDRCRNELPDEVAVAHCILHQAVLFNETMQDSLVTIVEIKTRQHAQDMNRSLYEVQQCLNDFVPKFFDQLLVDAYTNNCSFLRVVNASVEDLVKDKWRKNEPVFPKKWGPVVKLLKKKLSTPKQQLQEPLFLTLFAANLTADDILKALYRK